MLGGEQASHDDPVVAMWREYRVAKIFGWTPDQIDGAPGHWLDWALEIDKLSG